MAARDPVCGKDVDELRARAVAIFGKRTYYFCSAEHKAEFVREPAKYMDGGGVPVAVGTGTERSAKAEKSARAAAEKSAKLAAAQAEKSAKVAAASAEKSAPAAEKSGNVVATISAPARVVVEEAATEVVEPIGEAEAAPAARAGRVPRWMIAVVAVVVALVGVVLWMVAKR